MEDSIEVRHPGSDRGFVLLRVENTRDKDSFVRFDDAPLDLCHGPAIAGVVSRLGTLSIPTGFNSRCQLLDRLEYGTAQLIPLSAV